VKYINNFFRLVYCFSETKLDPNTFVGKHGPPPRANYNQEVIKLNSFGTNTDISNDTIRHLFFNQVKALTEQTSRFESINTQFSDVWA